MTQDKTQLRVKAQRTGAVDAKNGAGDRRMTEDVLLQLARMYVKAEADDDTSVRLAASDTIKEVLHLRNTQWVLMRQIEKMQSGDLEGMSSRETDG